MAPTLMVQASAVKLISSIEVDNDQNLVFDSRAVGFLFRSCVGWVLFQVA